MTARPTLLVFTLGAAAERARRPLLPAEHGAAELALRHGCLQAAVEAGREAGCRVVVSAPRDVPRPRWVELQSQEGHGFGDRLERACRRAAEEESRLAESTSSGAPSGSGARAPLIVVGTDVPGLRAAHLRQAQAALEADPDCVVLGPSPDGGFYLLATARPLDGLAGRTRWCRRDTLLRLRRNLARSGRRVVTLEPLRDLDRRSDLERWMAQGPPADLPGGTGRRRAAVRRRRGTGVAACTAASQATSQATSQAASPATSAPGAGRREIHSTPLFRATAWRSLLRHLARTLAALRRPGSRTVPSIPAPAPMPVPAPRGPPFPLHQDLP